MQTRPRGGFMFVTAFFGRMAILAEGAGGGDRYDFWIRNSA
jgi:hypothetical protein